MTIRTLQSWQQNLTLSYILWFYCDLRIFMCQPWSRYDIQRELSISWGFIFDKETIWDCLESLFVCKFRWMINEGTSFTIDQIPEYVWYQIWQIYFLDRSCNLRNLLKFFLIFSHIFLYLQIYFLDRSCNLRNLLKFFLIFSHICYR